MSALLLRLAGPTQAWRVYRQAMWPLRSIMKQGPQDLIPTRSAIAGLLGAALGRERLPGRRRGENLRDLAELRVIVRVDQPGRPRTDFRLRPRLTDRGEVLTQGVSERVLDDAVFLAGIDGDDKLVRECTAALQRPAYPLSLGARAYPVTLPLSLGVVDEDAEIAVRAYPWIASPWWQAVAMAEPDWLAAIEGREERSGPALAMIEWRRGRRGELAPVVPAGAPALQTPPCASRDDPQAAR